jgi:alpha-galactosidase
MGNDLRTLSASSYTILNNPAVIAISQDPLGRSVARIRRDYNVAKDKYGIGETHIWSGKLDGGDQVLILLNAGGEDKEISVTLGEIFFHSGPEGSAPEVKQKWDVFDLWANRMNETVGQKILDASPEEAEKLIKAAHWYNSTALSYAEGLKQGDPRLLGRKEATLPAGARNSMVVRVKMHSVAMYRLRSADKSRKQKFRVQEEL